MKTWLPPGPPPRLFGVVGTPYEPPDDEHNDPSETATFVWERVHVEVTVYELYASSDEEQARRRADGTVEWSWGLAFRRQGKEVADVVPGESFPNPYTAAAHAERYLERLFADLGALLKGRAS